MEIIVTTAANGFIVRADKTIKKNGTYIFRSIDILKLIEFIGEVILDKKVEVKER